MIVKLIIILTEVIDKFITLITTDMLITDIIFFKDHKNALCFKNVQNLSLFTKIDSHIEWELILLIIKMQSEYDFKFLSDNELIIKKFNFLSFKKKVWSFLLLNFIFTAILLSHFDKLNEIVKSYNYNNTNHNL